MKALEMFGPYWDWVKRLFAYSQYCAGSDMSAVACRDFWTWVTCASIGIAALIILLIAKTIISEQLEFRRNANRLAKRAIVADAETMEEARWKGEDANDIELSQDELATQMREALNGRHAPGAVKP